MRKFKVRRKLMHGLKMYQKGDIIELDALDAGRMAWLGLVDGPLKEPKRRKRVKRDSTTD